MNPFPCDNIEKFKIKLFGDNCTQVDNLISLVQNHEQLNPDEWHAAKCLHLSCQNHTNITQAIQDTYNTRPLLALIQRTTQQGGFFPQKLQKSWKEHLVT